MRALLDINVLVALLDAAHVHHRLATSWLHERRDAGWASSPTTQAGCIRVMSSPAYPGSFSPAQVAERLRAATADPAHRFWAEDRDLLV